MANLATIIEGPLGALREQEVNLLADIADALNEMGDDAQQDRRRIMEISQDLQEMFFLVAVIGEFNAGKSTFINALLGDELLPMGITPTTEAIELIRYRETPMYQAIERTDGLREWAHPNTGAPGVAIVDTPGTGSVFQKHETIAKSFLHRSDLVIFVISAKRAFAETERLYLEMARNYGKKIILVVNQADLLEPDEMATVRRFIEQQVRELLDMQPLLFIVSAKEALRTRGDSNPAGGVEAVRAHLRGVLSEAPPTKQKMISQLDMANSVVKRHYNHLQARTDSVGSDTAKVRQVQQELEQQSMGLDKQLTNARHEIDSVFAGIRQRGVHFIDNNLSIRQVLGRRLNKEKLQAEFQEVVIGRALRDVNEATEGYVNAVIDHSRMYWRSVIDRLNELQDIIDQEIGGLDAGTYAQQRESLQEAIEIAETELQTYSRGHIIADLQATFENNINGFTTSTLAAVGGLIVILLATVGTPGPLLGAGAAALAFPAVVVAAPFTVLGGYAALRYYRRVTAETKADFANRVDKLEKTFHDALDELTRKERNRLKQYGSQVLTPIFSRLEALGKRYAEQSEHLKGFLDRIEALRGNIQAAK